MVSNGAFLLKEWVQGLHVLAVRNPNYWNNAATHLDGVKYLLRSRMRTPSSLDTARAACTSTAVVPRGQFEWIKQNLASELRVSPQLNTYYYGFNLTAPAVSGTAAGLRRALARDRSRAARAGRC